MIKIDEAYQLIWQSIFLVGLSVSVEGTPFPMFNENNPKDQVYLDYAAAARPSAEAIAEVFEFHERYLRTTDTSGFLRAETSKLELVRSSIKQFTNASMEFESVLTRSASEAISTVANGMAWHEGDEIVISEVEHPANIVPWMYLSKRYGLIVRCAKSRPDGHIDTDHLVSLLDKRTRLVSVSLLSHAFGTIQPISEIVDRITSSPILFLIDAAQAVGRLPVDLEKMPCDFLVASGRKALEAPMGTGFLCGRLRELEKLIPIFVSTRSLSIGASGAIEESKVPGRLEPNLPNLGCMFGLRRAIENLKTKDMVGISKHLISLADQVVDGLERLPKIQFPIVAPRGTQVGIVSFYVRSIPNNIVLKKLREQGVVLGKCILPKYPDTQPKELLRVSVGMATTASDIAKFLQALKRITFELD